MRSLRLRVLLVVGVLVLVGCSSESGAPVETVRLTSTVTTTSVVSSTVVSSSVPETAGSVPLVSSQEEIEAELIAVLDGGNEVFEAAAEAGLEQVDEFFGGDLAVQVAASLTQKAQNGWSTTGAFDRLSVESIEVIDGEAVIVECGVDATARVDSTGSTLIEPDETGLLRTYTLRLEEADEWRIVDISFGAERTECGS